MSLCDPSIGHRLPPGRGDTVGQAASFHDDSAGERLSYGLSDTSSAGRWRSERPGPKGRVETGTQELDNGGWQRVIFPQSPICYLALFQKEELSLLNQK